MTKRVSIAFSDETHAVLQEFAKIYEKSFSASVSDIIDGVVPELQKMTAMMAEAQNAPKELLEKRAADAQKFIEKTEKRKDTVVGDFMEEFQEVITGKKET